MTVEPDSDIIQRRGSARAGTLRVIGLSLALAATLELLLVVDAAATGAIEGAGPFLLDLVQKLPWAVIVCTGVWLGLEVGRRRPVAVGLAGLLSAPIASLLARSVAETVHTVAFATAPAVGPFLIASIKGTQYACLGFALGWLGLRAWARAHHHAAAGLVAGLLFGGVLLVLTVVNSPESASLAQVGGWVINELLFPVGCSLIVFSVRDLAPSG